MLGIREFGVYIPESRIENVFKKEKFGIDDAFLKDKIGVDRCAMKSADEETTDLALKAVERLFEKISVAREDIEVLLLVTQNPDVRMPHAGSILHEKLKLSYRCASFDLPLGCSGFVYGLSIITAFMQQNGMKKGLLVTSDPYSKCVCPEDKNTSLIFGDGAAATLITDDPILVPGAFDFGTLGAKWRDIKLENGYLYMNGQAVVKFVAKYVPENIRNSLAKNQLQLADIDRFVFHQGSRFIHKVISEYLDINPEKMPWDCRDYGNTVSSSIPIILEKELADSSWKRSMICGFGIGLSWGSTVLTRV